MRTQTRRRSWDSYVFGGQFDPINPFLMSAEGDSGEGGGGEGGGGGSGDGGAKSLTQEQVNAIVAKETKKASEKAAREAREAASKEWSEKETTLAKRIEELELAGKSADEQARIKADRDAKAAAKQIEEREATLKKQLAELTEGKSAAEAKLRTHIERSVLSAALQEANVLGTAVKDALQAFHASSTFELNDDGDVVSVTFGGVAHQSATEAAKAFLKERPYFQAATSAGGSGARGGSGNASTSGKPRHEMSTEELLAADAEKRAANHHR